MSYQEKSLYAQLVAVLALTAYYIHFLAYSHAGYHWSHAVILGLIIAVLIFLSIARRGTGNTVTDERDRRIRALGAHWGLAVLYIGITITLVAYWDHGNFQSSHHLIGLLFHLLILSLFVRIIRQLVAYKRS
jgi:hypothetical protein